MNFVNNVSQRNPFLILSLLSVSSEQMKRLEAQEKERREAEAAEAARNQEAAAAAAAEEGADAGAEEASEVSTPGQTDAFQDEGYSRVLGMLSRCWVLQRNCMSVLLACLKKFVLCTHV